MRLPLLAFSCFLAFLIFPHRMAGDPGPKSESKWTAVKRWNVWTRVTYDHVFNSTSECGGSTNSESHEITETNAAVEFFEHLYDEDSDGIDVISWHTDLGRGTGSKNVRDESVDCEGRQTKMTIHGSGGDPETFFVGLRIDQRKGTYELNAHTGVNYRLFRHVVTASGSEDDDFDNGGGHDLPIDDVPLPKGATTVLSGTHVFDKPPYAGNGTKIVVNWRVTPGDREEIDLVVEPDHFDEWLPEGGEEEDVVGNHLGIFARLRAKDGSVPQQKAVKMVFELVDTSRIPGVCGNRPQASVSDYDMKFDKEANPHLKVIGTWRQQAETEKGEYTEVTANVSSFDYGGWATLRVRAILSDGSEVVGHLKGDNSQTDIRLPKRKEDSKIADAWKKREGVESLEDGDDSEETPKLDGHLGDGLTLYEEYRGFKENGEFFRAKPKRKELFIVDSVGGRTKDGIALLRAATDLLIYHKLLQNEADEDGVINGNHGGKIPRVGNTWAVKLEKNPDENVSVSQGNGSTGGPKKVQMGSGFDPGPAGWNKSWGNRVITDEYAVTVAHEILHCLRVSHHGEGDPGNKCWKAEVGDLGLLEIKEYAMVGKYGNVTSSTGHPIRVFTEDGRELGPNSRALDFPYYVYVAGAHGQHSGYEDCLMRYSCAGAYVSPTDPAVRYLVPDGEMSGIGLCRNPRGTGVNDPGHKPQPRYGDAALGKCKDQACVKDSAH